jgi:hypothetical protein
MPQTVRLTITSIELTPDGILIRSMEVIDGVTGERLKIAKLNNELTEFLKVLEIDVTDFMKVQDMKKKNPSFAKLADTFKLYK